MSIKVWVYITESEPERVEKKLGSSLSLDAVLLDNVSVLRPSFTIRGSANLAKYNYVYIPDFQRYYFITNITSMRNLLWKVDCRVDVLMTYRAKLKQTDAIVTRNEKTWNLYLNDPYFKTTNKRLVQTYNFPYSFSRQQSYVLALAGSGSGGSV